MKQLLRVLSIILSTIFASSGMCHPFRTKLYPIPKIVCHKQRILKNNPSEIIVSRARAIVNGMV